MKKLLGLLFIALLLVITFEKPTSKNHENLFDSHGKVNFELLTTANPNGKKIYILKGPHGEQRLNIQVGSLSLSRALLASVPLQGGEVEIDHMQTGETLQKLYLPKHDGISEMTWSPTHKKIAFVLTNKKKYKDTTKIYIANIENNSYNVFDLKVPYNCNAECTPEKLVWSEDGEEILGLTYEENKKGKNYAFILMNNEGKILNEIEIPEKNSSIPNEFKISDDKDGIEYRFASEETWRKIIIES